jgi:hypothetical protein
MGGQPLSPQQVINQWQRSFEQRITLAVKSLLETKHLYQSVTLEYEDLFDSIGEITGKQSLEDIKTSFSESIQANWFATDRLNPNYITSGTKPSPFCFETPDIKLFCHICERVGLLIRYQVQIFSNENQPRVIFSRPGREYRSLYSPFSVSHANPSPKYS